MCKPQKIMILGAGNTVFPLIQQAKCRGLTTIIVSPDGNYPGFALADHIVYCDVRDIDCILQQARHYAIDGITSTGTDIVVPVIGQLVDALGLPGTGHAASMICSDKWLMKQALLKAGVNTAQGVLCRFPEELTALGSRLGFPLMSKAVDSSGSQGVFRVDRPEDLREAWEASRQLSNTGAVILEQFLEGLEYGAQAIVEGRQVKQVLLHNDQLTPPPNHAPVGHSIPCRLTTEQQSRSQDEVRAAIRALDVCSVISNVDLMLVEDTPYIIEVGARMGATRLPETISLFGGFNAYDWVLSLALGEPLRLLDAPQGLANASRLIESPGNGTVRAIRVPGAVYQHPNLHQLSIYAKPGDRVRRFQVGPDRIGDLVVTADTVTEAEQLATQLVASIEIDLSPT